MTSSTPSGNAGISASDLNSLQIEFKVQPESFMDTLESFAKDLFLREVAYSYLRSLANYVNLNAGGSDMTICWIRVQAMVENLINESAKPAVNIDPRVRIVNRTLPVLRDFVEESRDGHDISMNTIDHFMGFLDRYVTVAEPAEANGTCAILINCFWRNFKLNILFSSEAYTQESTRPSVTRLQ